MSINDDGGKLRPGAASITIERDLASMFHLPIADVAGVTATLQLTDEDKKLVLDLAHQLEAEVNGGRDPALIGATIESFRQISREAYEKVGKPLYITLISPRPNTDG